MRTFFATVLTLLGCLSIATAQSDRTIHFFGVFCNAYEGIGGDINEGVSADQIMLDTVFTEYFSEQSWGVGLRRVQVIDQGGTKANIEAEFEAFLADADPEALWKCAKSLRRLCQAAACLLTPVWCERTGISWFASG